MGDLAEIAAMARYSSAVLAVYVGRPAFTRRDVASHPAMVDPVSVTLGIPWVRANATALGSL